MQTVSMFTIGELLATPAIKWNQTRLSELLHINRSTIRKYMNDKDNERHAVLFFDEKYHFHHSTNDHAKRRTIYG